MTETAQTIKDSLEVITPYLQSLADKLDTTASYLWAIQIKQAYIQGTILLVKPLILLLTAFIIFRISLFLSQKELENDIIKINKYNEKWQNEDHYHKKELPTISKYYLFIIFPATAVIMFSLLGFLENFDGILTCLFNPEYYALQQLINMFK